MTLGTSSAADQPPLKIGVVFSYTGPFAKEGREVDAAFAVYQQEHGDTIAGRKVEFIRRDTTGPVPDVAKRVAQDLIVGDKVDLILGPDYTPNALALAPLSTQAKKPVFIINAAANSILPKAPYMARFGFSTPQMAVPLAEWAAKNGVKSVYTVFSDYGPGIDAGTSFEKAFTAAGGKIVGEVRVPLNSSDFSAYVQRVKDAKPDAAFIWLPADNEPGIVLKSWADAGLSNKVKILATGDLVDEAFVNSIGAPAVGVVSSFNYSPLHQSAMNKAFVQKFAAVTGGKLQPDFAAVSAYDALAAVYKIVGAQHGMVDPDKTMDMVRAMKGESPRGPMAIDSGRDIVQNVYIRRVERGANGQLGNVEFDTIRAVNDEGMH